MCVCVCAVNRNRIKKRETETPDVSITVDRNIITIYIMTRTSSCSWRLADLGSIASISGAVVGGGAKKMEDPVGYVPDSAATMRLEV